MSLLTPPPEPPRIALAEPDGRHSLSFKLWLWSATAITIVVTGWLCSFDWMPTILALVVAKHVLVALLAMAIGVNEGKP